MNRIVGIDLGTSTSEVAILTNGKPFVIPNKEGDEITPSAVAKWDNDEIIVGKAAREQLIFKPDDTVIEVKRLMGSNTDVLMGEKKYKPEEISAYILQYLKECAEEYLDEELSRAVITVPAYFTDEQRRATVKAGELAGLKVERIINEPTAAALCYGIDHMEENHHVLVYDLGGGTLDVTILEMYSGVLEVKASSGNNHLGGKDFDQRIIDLLVKEFNEENDINILSDLRAAGRIKNAAEDCKIALSEEESYRVLLPFIAQKDKNTLSIDRTIKRKEFEALIEDLIESTRQPIEIALKDSGLNPSDINTVLLVGGSTRIPMVKNFLQNIMQQEPQSLVDPDLAVVMGAAIQAGIINRELSDENDILITDVCPYTLGIETMDIIGGMPMIDVYDIIIPRNTTVPVMKEKIYGTVSDNQSQVKIMVYQGDYKKASMNNFLGEFILDGIPPAHAFDEKIKVSFMYDINGILNVDALIISNNKKASIRIETTGVKLEGEPDWDQWQNHPNAKKYRHIIKKAERVINDLENLEAIELDGVLKDFKKALIDNSDDATIDELKEELTEALYSVEDLD